MGRLIEVDGSQYSGSGTLVRQAVVFSALTGRPVHIRHARARRPKPSLRPQHVRVVEAIRELVNGAVEGVHVDSQELTFRPGTFSTRQHFHWDIGSAGSSINLALAILPVLAFAPHETQVVLRGGLFQDRYCAFGGDLIVVTDAGGVWRVTSAGVPTRLVAAGSGGLAGSRA